MEKKVYALAALLLCCAEFPACSDKEDVKENDPVFEEVKQQTLSLTVNASKNKDSKISKALAESGQNLAATWGENDEVSVYDGETYSKTHLPISPPSASISKTRCPFPDPPTEGLHGIFATASRERVKRAHFIPVRAAARAASHPA